MNGIDIYITLTITLFGIAYPILLQIVSRIDEKYISENILNLFGREKQGKFFIWSLIFSIGSIVIWSLNLKPRIQIDGFNYLINNSANLLVSLSTILTTIAYFRYISITIVYYSPSKLIKYLIKKDKQRTNDPSKILKYLLSVDKPGRKSTKWFLNYLLKIDRKRINNYSFLESIYDLLVASIKNYQPGILSTISDYFTDLFGKEKTNQKNVLVEFPDIYYELVYKMVGELALLKERKNHYLEAKSIGGLWMFGTFENPGISEKTYLWLWHNILVSVEYNQDDQIIKYWEFAHQYFVYHLPHISEESQITGEELIITNIDDVKRRNKERERFLEFHYALGGLLMYQKKYDCLSRIFAHTMSIPQKYELLPESMTSIFQFFYKIRDPYETNFTWISHKYPFPKLSGLNADYTIKHWICSYMGVLFLRQYSIIPYLSLIEPLRYPTVPNTQAEIKDWIDGIEYFHQIVQNQLLNKQLIETLNLNFISDPWCIERHYPNPMEFFTTLKANLEDLYTSNALTLEIVREKVNTFYESSLSILQKTLNNYRQISNPNELEGETTAWFITGATMLQSKDAFSAHPEVHHMNFDSILAQMLSRKIDEEIANTFHIKRSDYYLFKPEMIFKAIEKLAINKEMIIIGFGVNKQYYIDSLGYQEIQTGTYNGTKIVFFPGSYVVRNCFYILEKSNLPTLNLKEISQDIIDSYELHNLPPLDNVYGSVIDLNNASEEILREGQKQLQGDELRKSAFISLVLSLKIKWKNEVKVIRISEYSEYRHKGLPNELIDIKA